MRFRRRTTRNRHDIQANEAARRQASQQASQDTSSPLYPSVYLSGGYEQSASQDCGSSYSTGSDSSSSSYSSDSGGGYSDGGGGGGCD